jgi:hypothetical protein
VYADYHVVKNLVNITVPLLRAAGEREKVVLSPLPRYLKRCCSDEEHLTNRREKRKFCIKMGEAMSEIKDTIRDVIFGKKIRSFKVLSSLQLLADADDPDQYENLKHLQEDPVHLTKDGYSTVFKSLLQAVEEGTFTRADRSGAHAPPPAHSGESGRGKSNFNFKRRGWVSRDDTLAHRDYGQRGSQRGRGNWMPRGSHSQPRGRGSFSNRGQRGSDTWRGAGRSKQRGHRSWPY